MSKIKTNTSINLSLSTQDQNDTITSLLGSFGSLQLSLIEHEDSQCILKQDETLEFKILPFTLDTDTKMQIKLQLNRMEVICMKQSHFIKETDYKIVVAKVSDNLEGLNPRNILSNYLERKDREFTHQWNNPDRRSW